MSVNVKINQRDLRDLRKAFSNSSSTVRSASDRMMTNIRRELLSTIRNNPWNIGGRGGGVPVRTGDLRGSHQTRQTPFELRIWVPDSHPYAQYVHEGTSRMEARPWMEYSVNKAEGTVQKEVNKFLDSTVRGLAR